MKNFDVSCPPRGLVLGYAGENIARGQAFDFTAWAEEYGAGSLQVVLQRPGDAAPYPVALTVEGTVATWLPTETDLQEAGTGQLQLIYTVGAVRVKTLIVSVLIGPSLGSSGEVPAPGQAWIDQLTDLAAETEQHAASAAQSAENAAASATGAQRSATDAKNAKTAAVAAAGSAAASASHYPQIVGGVWYVWSPTAGEYISTGIDAQGEDGVSPTVEITAIQGGHRVVITDAAGPHTFDVLDGVTPDLSAYRTAADQDVIDDAQDDQIADLKSALNTKAGILRDTVSGSVASFVPDATIPDLLGLDVHLEPIQDLHGYDSPWPAGGGKNLFNQAEAVDGVYINDSDGAERAQIGSAATGFIPVTAGLPYRMSPTLTAGNWGAFYDADKVFISGFTGYGSSKTAPTGAAYLRCTINRNNNNTDWATNFQVEQNTEATTYSPYSNICPISGHDSVTVNANGTTHTIQLGETVYGGTLDVTAGTLTVDRAMVDLGTLKWHVNGNYYQGASVLVNAKAPTSNSETAHIVSDRVDVISVASMNTKNVAIGMLTSGKLFTPTSIWDSTPIGQLCYELATPIVIDLDPVQIATIANQINNVFSPDGDVTVDYAADLKTYIDNKIAATVAAMS